MPEWITALVTKILGNEPLVKVMYIVLVWVIILFIAPESVAGEITSRSGIPFFGQITFAALAFILVDAAHRCMRRWDLRTEARKAESLRFKAVQEREDELINEFDLLDENEKARLRLFFERGENTLWFSTKDLAAMSLSSKHFLDCMHDSRYVNTDFQMTYSINKKYAAFLKRKFSGSNA